MFQRVMLSVSSNVILFHRRRKKAGRKNGKIKGENMEKAPEPEGGRENVRMAARKQSKTAENHTGGTKPAKERL